jgi:hypothetical protein
MAAPLLAEFVVRLAFGLATTLACMPPNRLPAGFYRVHLWILLGLNTFAILAGRSPSQVSSRSYLVLVTSAAAVLSFLGSLLWSREKRKSGRILLVAVAWLDLLGAWWIIGGWHATGDPTQAFGLGAEIVSSGLVLGVALAAMLLGHWYLNAPGLDLAPIQRLVAALMAILLLRALICLFEWASSPPGGLPNWWWMMACLRWLAGLAGAFVLALLSWQTLKIPNTQSATGMLYVVVIFVFLGELTSQLVAAESALPR